MILLHYSSLFKSQDRESSSVRDKKDNCFPKLTVEINRKLLLPFFSLKSAVFSVPEKGSFLY
jgi:hypothetical protein